MAFVYQGSTFLGLLQKYIYCNLSVLRPSTFVPRRIGININPSSNFVCATFGWSLKKSIKSRKCISTKGFWLPTDGSTTCSKRTGSGRLAHPGSPHTSLVKPLLLENNMWDCMFANMSNKWNTAGGTDRDQTWKMGSTEALKTRWQGHPLQALLEITAKTPA